MPRPPSLLDSVLPVVVLIVLIVLTIWLFGIHSTNGPLQVALLLSGAFAALIALKNGHSISALGEAGVAGVAAAIPAIFILLAVGALIGTWNMAGTIPTVVDYGVRLLNPSIFFFATAAICAIVGMVTVGRARLCACSRPQRGARRAREPRRTALHRPP